MTVRRHAHPDLWFLDTRVTIQLASAEGADGLSVLEHRAPLGDSPPLHVHRDEDEAFCVLAGELLVKVGDTEMRAGAGSTVLAPKGTPHTYRVESAGGARWLTIMRGDAFESFVRALGRPAEGSGLPEPAGLPTPEQMEALAAAAAKHGIDLVGPPLP